MKENEIYQAELRRLVRNLGMKFSTAHHKSQHKGDQFAIYHLGQALAYEEAIEIVKKVFHEEMSGEDWE